ncbi:MAG: monofunctional biosynthetic peptidoglycan transglycosylase [Kofleriaceae bacterium]
MVEPAPTVVPRPRRLRMYLATAAEVLLILAATGALALWCSVPNPRPLGERNPDSTAFIDLRRDQAEAAGKRFELKWQWRPLNRISRYLRAAVIYAEDYNFFRHDGVDWGALEDALESNLDKGSLSIGGSTITQQLAKNLYLSPNRSMLRKARELLIAFSLEDHLSKQRILELYLNVVEWGDGVFGAEAAAQKWFGHSAQTLAPAEAVRLAIALPNPIQRAPSVRSPELTRKAVRIIRLLRMQGLIDEDQERQALDQVGAPGEKVMPGRRPDVPDKPDKPVPDAPDVPVFPDAPDPPAEPPAE